MTHFLLVRDTGWGRRRSFSVRVTSVFPGCLRWVGWLIFAVDFKAAASLSIINEAVQICCLTVNQSSPDVLLGASEPGTGLFREKFSCWTFQLFAVRTGSVPGVRVVYDVLLAGRCGLLLACLHPSQNLVSILSRYLHNTTSVCLADQHQQTGQRLGQSFSSCFRGGFAFLILEQFWLIWRALTVDWKVLRLFIFNFFLSFTF